MRCAIGATAVWLVLLSSWAWGGTRVVAVTGHHAPGTAEHETFRRLTFRGIDARGCVAFGGRLEPPAERGEIARDSGLWVERTPGDAQLILRAGREMTLGEQIKRFINVAHLNAALSDQGELAFFADLFADNERQTALWIWQGEDIQAPVAAQSMVAPDSDGKHFAHFDGESHGIGGGGAQGSQKSFINRAGQMTFVGQLQEDLPQERDFPPFGPMQHEPPWHLWLRERDGTIHHVTDGGRIMLHTTLFNDHGEIVFGRVVSDRRPDSEGTGNIFLVSRGVAFPILGPTDVVVLQPGERLQPESISCSGINNSGTLALEMRLRRERQNLTAVGELRIGQPVRLIAFTGMDAPGLPQSTVFEETHAPLINGDGTLVFTASTVKSDPEVQGLPWASGIWESKGDQLQPIVVDGQIAPGTDGATFGRPAAELQEERQQNGRSSHYSVTINDHGLIAFSASLAPSAGVTPENDQGIWVRDSKGQLHLVVRTGDEIEVAPGEQRRVKLVFGVNGTGNEDGRPTQFNERGELAFAVKFTDDSEGIFVSDLAAIDSANVPTVSLDETLPHKTSDTERRQAQQEVEQLLDKLNPQIDQLLTGSALRALEGIAEQLRSEYDKNQAEVERLQARIVDPTQPPPDELKRLTQRQRVLVAYWEDLSSHVVSRNFANTPALPSLELTRKSAELMRRSGGDPDVHARLQQAMRKYSEIPPLEIPLARRVDRMVLAPFAEPLDPDSAAQNDRLRPSRPFPRPDGGEFDANTEQEDESDFNVIRPRLQRLLKLKWQGEGLTIDRGHWQETTDDISPASVERAVDLMIQRSGLPAGAIERNSDDPFSRIRRASPAPSKAEQLFEAIAGSRRGGGGGGSSGNVFHRRFRTDLRNAQMRWSESSFEFAINERDASRILRVESDDQSGQLKIVSVTDEGELVLDQSSGQVRIIDATRQPAFAATGNSLLEIYAKQPDAIEQSLFVTLADIGILPPLKRFDTSVVSRVVEELAAMTTPVNADDFAKLVAELDSSVFDIRDRAEVELRRGMRRYRDRLSESLNQPGMSLESRSRIQKLLAEKQEGQDEVEMFVDHLGLTSDISYLAALLAKCSPAQRPPVSQRLQTLTGQDYGNNSAQWLRWIESQQPSTISTPTP